MKTLPLISFLASLGAPSPFLFLSHLGDGKPHGMWKDVAATIPARSSGDQVAALTDLCGAIIATQPDATAQGTLQYANGVPVLHLGEGAYYLSPVSLALPYSFAVAETPDVLGGAHRTLAANGQNAVSLARANFNAMLNSKAVYDGAPLGKGVGIITSAARNHFYFNGQDITNESEADQGGVAWGQIGLGAVPPYNESGNTSLTAAVAFPIELTPAQAQELSIFLAGLLPPA